VTVRNDLTDLIREYGVEVHMLGTGEEPTPTGVVLADMLTEISTLRSRISAERQPVSDDVSGRIADVLHSRHRVFLAQPACDECERLAGHIISDDVVRAALGPAAPVIPDGWRLRHIIPVGPAFRAVLDWEDWKSISAVAYTPNDALTAAIAAAKESEE
jgi:hypothetical protein